MSEIKVNVNFFRVDPYALCITHGLFRIPWYFEFGFFGRNYSSRRLTAKTQVKVQVICDKKYFETQTPWEIFQGRPKKEKNPTLWKNIIFRERLFWETEAQFGKFGNFPHIFGMWGKIAKPPKFGFTFSKQPPQKYFETISASESGPIDRKFWLQANTTLFSTFYHFDQPLPRWRPPCREQYSVSMCCQ